MTDDQISSAVAEQIASYKKPRYVDFVETLPRTPDGDIDRTAVKAAHGER
jgi:long-chain acyl-CoA synthetase